MTAQELNHILMSCNPKAEVVLSPFKEGSIINNYLIAVKTERSNVIVELVFGGTDE